MNQEEEKFKFGNQLARIRIELPNGTYTLVDAPKKLVEELNSVKAARFQPQQIKLRIEYA